MTAVVVTHDGQAWLPRLLRALGDQTRPPDRVVVVDTGSRDTTGDLLGQVPGWVRVTARRATPPGVAYALGAAHALSAAAPGEAPESGGRSPGWLWLLHDDCAPAPDALEHLLAVAARTPTAGVLGPKLRAWGRRAGGPRTLQEVGVSLTRSGRRETGLDFPELDQGQHDQVRDVLAVSSAGMLVRLDVWDELGGYDEALPAAGDDVDFCWRAHLAGHRVLVVPDAVVAHVAALTRGARPLDAVAPGPRALSRRPRFQARRAGCYTVLVNRPLWTVAPTGLFLLLSGVLHALAALVAKDPGRAADELVAPLSVLGRPDVLMRGRSRRRATRRVASGQVSPLLASGLHGLARGWDAWRGRIGRIAPAAPQPLTGAPLETGPVSEDSQALERTAGGWRRALRRPGVDVLLVLSVLTLVAFRRLVGPGRLTGGALLDTAGGAGALWRSYLSAWHAVDLGSATPAPPWMAVLSALGGLTGGRVDLAVDLLLVAAVPAAGLAAYLATRAVFARRVVRVWVAVTYALLPAVTGAVATGRIGTAVCAVLLPVVAAAAVRAAGVPARPGATSAAFGAGLALAVMTAFVPSTYLLALAVAVVAAAFVVRSVGAAARLAVVLAVPALVCLPWTGHAVGHADVLFGESGLPVPSGRSPAWALALLDPGGPATGPAFIGAGVLLGALAALLRPTRRAAVGGAWALAALGLAGAIGLSRVTLTGPAVTTPTPAWPGVATLVAGAGMLLAGGLGAEGLRERLAAASFGWRQPTAVLVSLLAIAVPLVAAAAWVVRGADGPLRRAGAPAVPAYAAAASAAAGDPRVLILASGQAAAPASVRYALVRGGGARVGDAALLGERGPGSARAAALVADLAAGRPDGFARRLGDLGVRFVVVRDGHGPARAVSPTARQLAARLDAAEGLRRLSSTGGNALWTVTGPTGLARVLSPGGGTLAVLPTRADDPLRAGGRIPAVAAARPATPSGVAGAARPPRAAPTPSRRLVLAEQADPGWRATLDGAALRPGVHAGWAQAFVLPPGGGRLEVWYDGRSRSHWLTAEAVLLALVVLGALPTRRAVPEPERAELAEAPAARHALVGTPGEPGDAP